MVDNLLYQVERLSALPPPGVVVEFRRQHPRFAVVTMHRPSNVDDPATLAGLAAALVEIAATLPIAFPVHPRTRANLERFGIALGANITLMPPLAYNEFLHLWKDAALVITDSGGMQEETTALGIPCVTMRNNTERPVTVDEGTNVLAGTDPKAILAAVADILAGRGKAGRRPALWDGHAAERTVEILINELAD
jgi:UDP-N-acetylglucosamine 2-epimerase (non-hydrolysing)